ncbi:hypothetical protein RRF57_004320 [Xylaria bambusicola]|uniref:Uncharacterized protein n=1 Tax=Xylaria bambusicola TaxID=326684 RepID=A0AAN7ULQ0_9PEZI
MFFTKHSLRFLPNERTFAKDSLFGAADGGGAVAILKGLCNYGRNMSIYARWGGKGKKEKKRKDTANNLAESNRSDKSPSGGHDFW